MILNKFPEVDEFYKSYWGKKPFIVRGAIDQCVFDNLIDSNSLAGLALEEDIKSRLVITEPDNKWVCHHGPFDEDRFSTLGNKNWSLLVQNVDQFHPETSQLLKSFNFSPRWLMDDIMVSYSTVGGSVGPHMDSYHVFLAQGKGKRTWKVSHDPIENKEYLDNNDLLVFKDSFEGLTTEVSIGDVIYIPPHFGHQGVTTENAMTFSVGFLGPRLSEILGEYSHYLEQHEQLDTRYTGQGLNKSSAPFLISHDAINKVQTDLVATINADCFSTWVAEYFSTSMHNEFRETDLEEDDIPTEDLLGALNRGQVLYRPEHIKIASTINVDGEINLAIYGETIVVPAAYKKLIEWLNHNHNITIDDLNDNDLAELVTHLYNKGILTYSSEEQTPSDNRLDRHCPCEYCSGI